MSYLWSNRWLNGTVVSQQGTWINVVYDDGAKDSHDLARSTHLWRLFGNATGTNVVRWRCIKCGHMNSCDGDPTGTACIKCRIAYNLSGVIEDDGTSDGQRQRSSRRLAGVAKTSGKEDSGTTDSGAHAALSGNAEHGATATSHF